MQQLIDDMKAIPGVIGACTYNSKGGVGSNNLPSLFKEEKLHDTARHLTKIHAAGRLNFPDLTEIMVNYEESVIVFRQIDLNDHLITICDPGINLNLLAMSLNLAIENVLQQPASEKIEEKNKVSEPPATPDKPRVDPSELFEKGPLAQPLRAMLKLLSKVIGPMAKIVFDDALARWVQSNQTKKGSLSKLLEIVCQEIGDEEKSKEYRELVRQKMTTRPKKQEES